MTNSLNQFFKEMYEDQSEEFVFGNLDLKGEQCSLVKISILTPLVYSSLYASQHLPLISFSCTPSKGNRVGMSRFGVDYNNRDLSVPKISFLTLVVDWNFPFCSSSSLSLCGVPVHNLQHPQLFSLVFLVSYHFCMDKQLSFNEDLCIYVVVQFYPWFKFSFLLFQTHYHVIIIHYLTQKPKKINLIKDKIEPQHRVVAKEIARWLKRKWRQQKEGGMAPSLPTLGTVWVFSSVSY